MDCVTELAARATSYLVLLQDALAMQNTEIINSSETESPILLSPKLAQSDALSKNKLKSLSNSLFGAHLLKAKASGLVESANLQDVISGTKRRYDPTKAQDDFERQAHALLLFIQSYFTDSLLKETLLSPSEQASSGTEPAKVHKMIRRWHNTWNSFMMLFSAEEKQLPLPSQLDSYLPPESWRRLFRAILHQHPERRLELARYLEYIPSLITELLASKKINAADKKRWDNYLTLTEAELEAELIKGECAFPFEVIFARELREINARRKACHLAGSQAPDPLRRADELHLCGLAFSGGGIRSATFNLGILQGLASKGWLPRIDYLSTVSGGGYLGSWLVAWIKREGSVQKVVNRLCPVTSPLPHAEEVRPIRWLRMYSNYLNPNSSIFSTDSWTMGITWLRNTLLNQLIIILALASALALGAALLAGWHRFSWDDTTLTSDNQFRVLWFSMGPLLLAAGLASLGMYTFTHTPRWNFGSKMRWVVRGIVVVALAGAYATSAFLYHGDFKSWHDSFFLLLPATGLAAAALLLVAIMGRYDKCFYRRDESALNRLLHIWAWFVIGVTSIIAAVAGQLGMMGVWCLLDTLRELRPTSIEELQTLEKASRLIAPLRLYGPFIFGLPLVLETVVLTVIVRMALLGRNFPDERREWWGRLGAVLHLVILVWIVACGSTLLVRELALILEDKVISQAAIAGGWAAIIGKAVMNAFSSRTAAQPGSSSNWLEKILRLAPYVFALGLLLLTSSGVVWLLCHMGAPPSGIASTASTSDLFRLLLLNSSDVVFTRAWLLGGVLGGLAIFLGWRAGVNEFSLHHFYRNRLVRAYMGASRPRVERQQSANAFTSFDRKDDIKLCSLQRTDPLPPELQPAPQPFEGPYLIINATLNATKGKDLAQQDRQAESFVFTPCYCGFDFARIRAVDPRQRSTDFAYRPTHSYGYSKMFGPAVGTAMAISGAAANPNEGYHSSPATAFLLTLFNVRLGWWMGNPRNAQTWKQADPSFGLLYLLKDLFGRSNTSDRFVSLSDGGHFDNMGLYELVRRRCRYIILGDGEEDHRFTCEGLANAIRRCRVDFGVEINIDVSSITNRTDARSLSHYAVGTIRYPDDPAKTPSGYLLYLKSSLTGKEPTDVKEYAQNNVDFPHQSTGDQFFNEAQFESYRRLGLHVFESLFENNPGFLAPPVNLNPLFSSLK